MCSRQGRNREYARFKCADRDRFCRSMEGPLMKQNSTSVAAVYDRRSVIVGRFCETPRRLTQTPYSQIPPAFFAICLSLLCLTSLAQTPDNVAEREVQRRQAALPQGEAALARGKTAMKAKNYTLANEEFKTAVGSLPDSVVSGKAHDEAVDGFCKSAVILAQARIAQGDYAGAEAILSQALSSRYDPNCREAQELYKHLRTPGYCNKTITPNFINKVEEVKQLLTDADGFYQSGQYDLAMKRYDQVLALDPYNTAARKGQEKIDNTKYQYGEEAYDETRARQLWKVEKAWEQPVRKYGVTGAPAAIGASRNLGGTAQMNKKLSSIIIPHLEFRDASIREAIDVIREQAAENDTGPEDQRGVNIVLRLVPLGQIAPPSISIPIAPPTGTGTPPPAGAPAGPPPLPGQANAPGQAGPGGTPLPAPPAGPATARITVTMDNVPLGDALRYIANQAALKVKVEPYAVSVIPLSEQTNELITKRYHVPPEFFGGPLDPGYYLTQNLSGSTQQGQTGTLLNVPPVSGKIVEQEQYNAATTTEYTSANQTQYTQTGAASAGQALRTTNPGGGGISTTRQS